MRFIAPERARFSKATGASRRETCNVRVGNANSTPSFSSDLHYLQQYVLTLFQLRGSGP